MKLRIALKLVFGLGISLVMLTAGASSQKVLGQDCSQVTDPMIVQSILSRIQNDSGLSKQMSHINVQSTFQAVKLQGWTDKTSDFTKVIDIVRTTSCVRVINVNAFEPTPPDEGSNFRAVGGCVKGTKACGDICIPEGDSCNITGTSKQ